MSGRRLRNLLLLVLLGAVAYWYFKDQPTVAGLVDDLTRPLFRSHAAVNESERSRVINDASAVIGQQTDENVGALHENMSMPDVRELLGYPDRVETLSSQDPVRVRWTYRIVHRAVLFENGRVVSIAIR